MRKFAFTCLAPVVLSLSLHGAAMARSSDSDAKLETARTKVAEAIEAIREYSAAERAEALEKARAALDQLDTALGERSDEMRDRWNEMSEESRDAADEKLEELTKRRILLAEKLGILEAGSESAWSEMKSGLSAAWKELSDAIEDSKDLDAD